MIYIILKFICSIEYIYIEWIQISVSSLMIFTVFTNRYVEQWVKYIYVFFCFILILWFFFVYWILFLLSFLVNLQLGLKPQNALNRSLNVTYSKSFQGSPKTLPINPRLYTQIVLKRYFQGFFFYNFFLKYEDFTFYFYFFLNAENKNCPKVIVVFTSNDI